MTDAHWCHYVGCQNRAEPLRPMGDDPDPGVPICRPHYRHVLWALRAEDPVARRMVVERTRDPEGHPSVDVRERGT